MARLVETLGKDVSALGDSFAASMHVFGQLATLGNNEQRAGAFLPGLETWLGWVKTYWAESNFRRSPATVVNIVGSLVDHNEESPGSSPLAGHTDWCSFPRSWAFTRRVSYVGESYRET